MWKSSNTIQQLDFSAAFARVITMRGWGSIALTGTPLGNQILLELAQRHFKNSWKMVKRNVDFTAIRSPHWFFKRVLFVKAMISFSGSNKVYPLINPKKQSTKKDYKNSGTLHFVQVAVVKRYSFLEFVKGGTDINFTVAIDFTGEMRLNDLLVNTNVNHWQS